MYEPYYSFSTFLKNKFNNQKIKKIPINAGFLCPNKDGNKSSDGCIFCDQYGSGPIKNFNLSISEQINEYINNHPKHKYIAYFQAHTNTYAHVEELKKKYEIIFNFKDIVGLFIGTRPDSIKDEVYSLFDQLNRRTYLTIELGLQSIHTKSLHYLNRNHTYRDFLGTFSRLKEKNIETVVHLIIGIPGESKSDMLKTIEEINRIKPAGIKFHLMHILKNTPLYNIYKKEKIKLLEKEEYIDLIIFLLENLDPEIVIHRLTGERDREIFFAPKWALSKMDIINSIRTKMVNLKIFQGIRLNR